MEGPTHILQQLQLPNFILQPPAVLCVAFKLIQWGCVYLYDMFCDCSPQHNQLDIIQLLQQLEFAPHQWSS